MRQAYVAALVPHVIALSSDLLSGVAALRLKRGWTEGVSLEAELTKNWGRDSRHRSTTVGPHRAELEILLDGLPARERISRGQQKLLACVMVLAQLRLHAMLGGDPGTLLLDDPAAELDVNNLGKLMHVIHCMPTQVIATAVDPRTVEVIRPAKKFHVEQGQIQPVV
jgi:DNA replication and repair protein RecF